MLSPLQPPLKSMKQRPAFAKQTYSSLQTSTKISKRRPITDKKSAFTALFKMALQFAKEARQLELTNPKAAIQKKLKSEALTKDLVELIKM